MGHLPLGSLDTARAGFTKEIFNNFVYADDPTRFDLLRLIWHPTEIEFQSTRPHGARLGAKAARVVYHVSIHAPARGATLNSSCCYPFGLVSIHAPARGATKADEEAREGNKFQSTRPHGARR